MGGEGAGNKERGGLSLAQRKKARAKIGEGGSEKADPSSPTRRKLAKTLLVKPAPGSCLSGWLKAFLFEKIPCVPLNDSTIPGKPLDL